MLKLLTKNLAITMMKCVYFWVGMNDVNHVMKKHQQPVTESQTLDGASCCYSQRSKVVAAVGRLRLRASSRCCCRVRTTRRRQLKQQQQHQVARNTTLSRTSLVGNDDVDFESFCSQFLPPFSL